MKIILYCLYISRPFWNTLFDVNGVLIIWDNWTHQKQDSLWKGRRRSITTTNHKSLQGTSEKRQFVLIVSSTRDL